MTASAHSLVLFPLEHHSSSCSVCVCLSVVQLDLFGINE